MSGNAFKQALQAESATALSNLKAICAVDGVDGVFIGPADLAASTQSARKLAGEFGFGTEGTTATAGASAY